MKIYVDRKSNQNGNGTKECPFMTISQAAEIAVAGDEVLVMPGIYREDVNPKNAGTPDARIVYRSVVTGGAVITGAEEIKTWKPVSDNVWVARIPNKVFGERNPYTIKVSGDWFNPKCFAHLGEVYLNGKSLYEVAEIEKVHSPEVYKLSWDPDFSVYTWYTEQDADETVIYANFHGKNPNEECVEINVRRHCFYPLQEGIGYITVSGFVMKQAATQWAPPTAYQEGLIGPHWSKGWIIEDCEISHSKCSGVSLGKYLQPENDNKWLNKKIKTGTQTERECICRALREGWTKENVGSHIVRRCNIHDCGQTGIVGHLGGVFSIIEDNHIHHINNKRNLAGEEIAGIKMHAAIDVIFRRNHIHHCTRGIWLDWQAQGTRVTQNLLHDNTLPFEANANADNSDSAGEDLFIEVSHGPTLVDNNVMLSDFALKLPAQGIAVVHNLIAGSFTAVGRGVSNGTKIYPSPRCMPYHVQHRTEIEGFTTIRHGDMRFYNNIIIQKPVRPGIADIHELMKDSIWCEFNPIAGTWVYEEYPSYDEFMQAFEGYCGTKSGKRDVYYAPLPVWFSGNQFFGGAKPASAENDAFTDTEHEIYIGLNEYYTLDTNVFDFVRTGTCKTISTETLGMAFDPEEYFENPDGTPITFDHDYFGKKHTSAPTAGPFVDTDGAKRPLI